MREVKIEKITLNIGCGTTVPVENAKTVLEQLSNSKAVITKTKKRTTFNVPKNKAIGCKVTIRKNTGEFLKNLLGAKDNKLNRTNFDNTGNLSFGIKEYIDVPGMGYEPKIGILGLDVCVTLQRPGYRVKRKKIAKPVGPSHRLTKEDAMNFMRDKFGVAIEE
jgi:large subunit ribosomal protein L5